jgi:RecA-family ATPase
MSKPKNMTPEEEAAWLEKARARARTYYLTKKTQVLEKQRNYRAANRLEIRRKGRIFSKSYYAENRKVCLERQIRYQKSNPEKLSAQRKAWRGRNHEYVLRYFRNYRAKNRDLVNAWSTQRTDALRDSYIALLLNIPVAILRQHPELLEAKREFLKAKRQLKNQTKINDAQESK